MSIDILKNLEDLKFQYEHLSIGQIEDLLFFYSDTAIFKDPFQQVQGHDAIGSVFKHMFLSLDEPHFVVKSIQYKGLEASLLWDFKFKFKRWNVSQQSITGVSWLEFNAQGKIQSHIDYWDPAEGIYEKLPLLGSLMRFLKRLA